MSLSRFLGCNKESEARRARLPLEQTAGAPKLAHEALQPRSVVSYTPLPRSHGRLLGGNFWSKSSLAFFFPPVGEHRWVVPRERLPRQCCPCGDSDSLSIVAVFSPFYPSSPFTAPFGSHSLISRPLGVCNFTRSLGVAGPTSRFQLHSRPALSGNLACLYCLLADRPTDPQRKNYPCCGH